jgi:gamma-glutamyl hydrolase
MSKDTVLFLFFIAIFQSFLSTKFHNSGFIPPTQLHHDSLVSLPVSCPTPDQNLYYQPVIGILSHPGDGASGRHSNATSASFIHASYVKFVEAAGARVVPLIYNEPLEMLVKVSSINSDLEMFVTILSTFFQSLQKLELANGVLFTGGSAKDGLYFETVRTIFKVFVYYF